MENKMFGRHHRLKNAWRLYKGVQTTFKNASVQKQGSMSVLLPLWELKHLPDQVDGLELKMTYKFNLTIRPICFIRGSS